MGIIGCDGHPARSAARRGAHPSRPELPADRRARDGAHRRGRDGAGAQPADRRPPSPTPRRSSRRSPVRRSSSTRAGRCSRGRWSCWPSSPIPRGRRTSSWATSASCRADADLQRAGIETRRGRVYAGYAGWGPGQLEGELEDEGWIVVEHPLADELFSPGPDDLWHDVLERQGGQLALVARMPLDPSLN